MNIQAILEQHALGSVPDIANNERYNKEHPHLHYTIIEFFINYMCAFDELSLAGKKLFKKQLRAKIEYLINLNKGGE